MSMFNTKKETGTDTMEKANVYKETKPTPAAETKPTPSPNYVDNSATTSGTNIVTEGTVIQGEIKSKQDIQIDGKVKGIIRSESRILVGRSGVVDGDVISKNGDISGKISGKIEVSEMLYLRANSVVDGDIVVGKLVVESGAIFNGNCRMGSSEVKKDAGKATSFQKTTSGQ